MRCMQNIKKFDSCDKKAMAQGNSLAKCGEIVFTGWQLPTLNGECCANDYSFIGSRGFLCYCACL